MNEELIHDPNSAYTIEMYKYDAQAQGDDESKKYTRHIKTVGKAREVFYEILTMARQAGRAEKENRFIFKINGTIEADIYCVYADLI